MKMENEQQLRKPFHVIFLDNLQEHCRKIDHALQHASNEADKREILNEALRKLSPLFKMRETPEDQIELSKIEDILTKLNKLYDSDEMCVGILEGIIGALGYFIHEMKTRRHAKGEEK
ncbi:MAG: hypothetical protein LBQ13_04330 [Endomicrobium sp.]|nr:hypothetical protein [Endomicrobium sp.]